MAPKMTKNQIEPVKNNASDDLADKYPQNPPKTTISKAVLIYAIALGIDFSALILLHLCLYGDCFLNAEVYDAQFWGKPCTGDFWTLARAGLDQGYWYIIISTICLAVVMLLFYAGWVVHLMRLLMLVINTGNNFAIKFTGNYLLIIAFNWLGLVIFAVIAFSLITYKCILDNTDLYCPTGPDGPDRASCENYENNICTYVILLKNADFGNRLDLVSTSTGWSLAMGWVAVIFLFASSIIYFALRLGVAIKRPDRTFMVDKNTLMPYVIKYL